MTQAALIKIAIWSCPVLLGAGGIYAQFVGTAAKVEEVEDEIEIHAALPGHPVDHQRLGDHAKVLEQSVVEQRGMRAEQTQIQIDVSAICQAVDCR